MVSEARHHSTVFDINKQQKRIPDTTAVRTVRILVHAYDSEDPTVTGSKT